MAALDAAAEQDGVCYLTGGATAVLLGWRPTTVDVDLKLVPEQDAVLRAIPQLKDELSINVELASPAELIPLPADWAKPVRCGNPTLARFDSGAAPSAPSSPPAATTVAQSRLLDTIQGAEYPRVRVFTLAASSTGWQVGIALGVAVIAVAAVIVIMIVLLAIRIARQAKAAEGAVEVVRQQTAELGGIARINDSGVRILHAARALRKVAVGK